MIIDSHCHLMARGWTHQSWNIGLFRIGAASMGMTDGVYPDAATLAAQMMPVLEDTTGEKLVSGMDAARVDRACIFALDYELATGNPGVPIEDQNRMVAEAARRYPDRLTAFFSIDPRRPEGLRMFQRAIEDWGMRGLKLHPTAGFYPHDAACYPFYQKCLDYGLPVTIHTGSQPAPLKSRFASPIHIDDVAADFPDLPIIMAHAAWWDWREALNVGLMKPNVHFDLSGWQIVLSVNPAEFYRMLRVMLDNFGPWRVFFGTDGPVCNLTLPLEQWVKAFKEPDLSSCPDIKFTKEEMEIVMGKAFARLMKLE